MGTDPSMTLIPRDTASQHQPYNDAFNATIFELLPGEVSRSLEYNETRNYHHAEYTADERM